MPTTTRLRHLMKLRIGIDVGGTFSGLAYPEKSKALNAGHTLVGQHWGNIDPREPPKTALCADAERVGSGDQRALGNPRGLGGGSRIALPRSG
jgi:hypothetical protein